MNANEPKFDLIVFGTTISGQELEKLAEDLSLLLKITHEQAKQLLETPASKTVAKAVSLETAGPVRDMILAIGIKANIIPTKPNSKLELVEIEKIKIFCPACGYLHLLEKNTPLPEVCINCAVVFSKYEKAQKEKEERDRVRNLLLIEHQSKIEAEKVRREAEEAELRRKQFEEEIRKKLGIPKILNSRSKLITSVIAVHTSGIVLGIGAMFFYGIFTQIPIKTSILTQQEMISKNPNLGIMAQMLIYKMLSTFNPSNIISTSSTLINNTTAIGPQTALAFLDSKLAELKTNPEWDQNLLIKIDSLLAKGDAASASQLLNKLNRVKLRFNRGGRLIGQLWNRNQNVVANKLYEELTFAGERLTGGPLARIEALCILGHYVNTAGHANKAKEVLKKARAFESSIIEPIDRAAANSEIAALMTALGQEEDARFLFSSAISALEEIQEPVQQLLGIASIAPSYAKAGYRTSALNLVENAIRKGSSISDARLRAQTLEQLAKVSSELSDLQMALTGVQQISNSVTRDQILHSIIIEETLADRLAQATDLSKHIKSPIYKALTFGFLGLNQKRETTYQGLASASFTQARQAMNSIAAKGEKAAVASELGRFAARSGDELNANVYFNESKQLIETITARAERDRALAILAINKAQTSYFNEAQADLEGIHDENLRRMIATDIKNWQ